MKRSFFGQLIFEKQPASFRSAFTLEESVQRLSSQVRRWPFVSPFRHSLVGSVKENKVTIARMVPFVSNSYAPVFYGAFQVREGAVMLEGYFALSRYARVFTAFWFGFVIFMAILFSLSVLSGAPVTTNPPMPQWQGKLLMILIPYALLLFGLIFTVAGKWLARKDARVISQKIQAALAPDTP